ncbi:hypothetical protein [Deinococcus sp.]|uniref:hypothetical protein n=1 Tax=Deinococcus sp. TaxID=47478 RepID=UPI003C7E27B3
MNTRIVKSRMLLTAGLLAVSAVAQAAQTGTVRLSDAKLPFSISLPRGWVGVQFKDGLSGVSIASQAKAPAALMRFTFIPKQGKTLVLKDEFAGFEQAVKQGGTTLRLVSEKAVRYGGVTGLSHVYDLTQQGKKLRMQIWFGGGVKNFYNFQLTDVAGTYSKRAPLFAAALNSVKFN